MINLKTPSEIAIMAKSGAILAKVFKQLRRTVRPGITTKELDELAHRLVLSYGAKPAFLDYPSSTGGGKSPGSLCVSVNDEIVHGIPLVNHILRDGDIVSLDFGVLYEAFFADSAITLPVGTISKEAKKLLEVTEYALRLGVDAARAGNTTGDIGHAVQRHVETQGFSVIRDLVGHGIGRGLHEAPQVPNFSSPSTGTKLELGMVIAIEPMVAIGSYAIKLAPDGWTYLTTDGSLAAHFEHTVAITKKGPKVLTK